MPGGYGAALPPRLRRFRDLVVRRPAGTASGGRHLQDAVGPDLLTELAARDIAPSHYDAR
ncbi:hypothetical protein E1281_10920 [Actinomadura sp. KC345]|uniref:hypothetical protein n=1 Tax=Actinomadura sp. KC345 TaxID=2530371 RepID=UPI0010435034|nr:hypothetical protein [Actinomadura sp. KC345]TDC55754.1 hypothetical protein E1281_10920 [Actinomadura sp. KC345]